MKQNSFPFVKCVSVREMPFPACKCDAPEIAEKVWKEKIATLPEFDPEKEHLYVLGLNTKYNLKAIAHVSTGTLNESLAHPREIFRPLVAMAAHSFILMHNHPSGDTAPSESDRRLTTRINECARLMQINLLDHVIVGGYRFSFRENGYL